MFQNLKEEDFHNLKWLENFIPKSDKAGNKLFNTSVKGKSILSKQPSAFRTYLLENVKQISWIELKLEAVEKAYGIIPSKKTLNEHDDLEKAPIKDAPQPTTTK
jgi:hypothetical protein